MCRFRKRKFIYIYFRARYRFSQNASQSDTPISLLKIFWKRIFLKHTCTLHAWCLRKESRLYLFRVSLFISRYYPKPQISSYLTRPSPNIHPPLSVRYCLKTRDWLATASLIIGVDTHPGPHLAPRVVVHLSASLTCERVYSPRRPKRRDTIHAVYTKISGINFVYVYIGAAGGLERARLLIRFSHFDRSCLVISGPSSSSLVCPSAAITSGRD